MPTVTHSPNCAYHIVEGKEKCNCGWFLFLEYHGHTGWAYAKAAIGGHLSTELVEYMRHELAARKVRKDAYAAWLKEQEDEDIKRSAPAQEAGSAGVGDPGAVTVCGEAGNAAEDTGVVPGAERNSDADFSRGNSAGDR